MILFLDFDGVLHPDPCFDSARLFEHAPRLAEALEPFSEVSIVLSTSWRTQYTFEQMVGPFPAALRDRVIGVTPLFAYGEAPPSLAPYRRQAECMQWLRANGDEQHRWLALDDRASLFVPYCERLILCDSQDGLTEPSLVRLSTALMRARQKSLQQVDALL